MEREGEIDRDRGGEIGTGRRREREREWKIEKKMKRKGEREREIERLQTAQEAGFAGPVLQ